MTRWLLALLFAFGSVTFLTGCPAEEETTLEGAIEEGKEAAEEGKEAAEEGKEAIEGAIEGAE